MEQETIEKPLAEQVKTQPVTKESADHEQVVQATRPGEQSEKADEKTVRVRLRVLEAAVAVRNGAFSLLAKITPSRGQKRPKAPATPIERPGPVYGTVHWAAPLLNQAPDALTKISIVRKIQVGTEKELDVALRMIKMCGGQDTKLLQGQLVLENSDLIIPVDSVAKILDLIQDPIVQWLMIERLPKTELPEDTFFGILAALKGEDAMEFFLKHFGLTLKATEPVKSQDAYLSPEKLMRDLRKNTHIKPAQHLGLALALKLNPQDIKPPIELALELASVLRDGEAIKAAFMRIGIRVTQLEDASTTTKEADTSSPSADLAETR